MKIKDVPQDNDLSYEGSKKLCYATDESGHFVPVGTSGWHVEETVKSLAWKVIDADLEITREKILRGEASPLEYFMKYRQMDPRLLSENMGIFILRVKWHLRPSVFKKLHNNWLARYSECLEIPLETLKNYDGKNGKPTI